jgi:hypothetical protein
MQAVYWATINGIRDLFKSCPDPDKTEHEGGWSIKQILGHLLDSASNNHQRLVRYNAQGNLDFPGYDQEAFVHRAHYADFAFEELLSLWHSYNRLLWHIISNIPAEDFSSTITVGDRPAVTIEQLVRDYLAHIEIHRRQVQRIIDSP